MERVEVKGLMSGQILFVEVLQIFEAMYFAERRRRKMCNNVTTLCNKILNSKSLFKFGESRSFLTDNALFSSTDISIDRQQNVCLEWLFIFCICCTSPFQKDVIFIIIFCLDFVSRFKIT